MPNETCYEADEEIQRSHVMWLKETLDKVQKPSNPILIHIIWYWGDVQFWSADIVSDANKLHCTMSEQIPTPAGTNYPGKCSHI
jgi:hypothetical protein